MNGDNTPIAFTGTEMCQDNNPLNCWKTLKPCEPQRKDEILMRDGGESGKNHMDSAWLNPKHYIMGNQQPSSEQEKVQRLRAPQAIGGDCGGRPMRVKI